MTRTTETTQTTGMTDDKKTETIWMKINHWDDRDDGDDRDDRDNRDDMDDQNLLQRSQMTKRQ